MLPILNFNKIFKLKSFKLKTCKLEVFKSKQQHTVNIANAMTRQSPVDAST